MTYVFGLLVHLEATKMKFEGEGYRSELKGRKKKNVGGFSSIVHVPTRCMPVMFLLRVGFGAGALFH